MIYQYVALDPTRLGAPKQGCGFSKSARDGRFIIIAVRDLPVATGRNRPEAVIPPAYKTRGDSECDIWPLLGLLRPTFGSILHCCILGFRNVQNKHIN